MRDMKNLRKYSKARMNSPTKFTRTINIKAKMASNVLKKYLVKAFQRRDQSLRVDSRK